MAGRRKRSLISPRRGRAEPAHAPAPASPDDEPAPIDAEADALTDEVAAAPVADDAEQVGPWVIDEVIDRTQGCRLTRAHHHQSSRIRCSLKILDAPDARGLDHLAREGEVLYGLDHANLPSVRNVMPTSDPPYLELELVRGEPLTRLLARRRTLYLAEALELVEQLVATLAFLHARSVHHLDVRPGNLLVRRDGVITLHGFARAHEGSPVDPEPDLPDGALPYRAPEWPDRPRPAGADLYGAGAILFELLTGQRPFHAPPTGGGLTMALVLRERARAPFLDPGERFQDDLRSVVRHLTTREPGRRLSDASRALARLQAVQRTYSAERGR